MSQNALDKVLRFAGAVEDEPPYEDLRELVAIAHSALRGAVLSADPAVAAQMVLMALGSLDGAAEQLFIEMTGPVPEDVLAFATMTTAARKKPGAHTIAGSTDYPIPDVRHLHLAVGRYHAGQFAGHSKEEVAAHIRSSAKRLGVSVNLSDAQDGPSVLLELAKAKAVVVSSDAMMSEHHGPMHGTHSHAHTHHLDNSHGMDAGEFGMANVHGNRIPGQHAAHIVSDAENRATWQRLNAEHHAKMMGTHSHAHTHLGDNMHGGRSDGSVGTRMGQNAWEQKGEAAWAAHRETWGQDAAADKASGAPVTSQHRGASGEAIGHRAVSQW